MKKHEISHDWQCCFYIGVLFADKSNLLLCQLESNKVGLMTAGSAVADFRTASPQCINVRNLQVYKSRDQPFLFLVHSVQQTSSA
jgi:hypothetical protein